MDFHIQRIFARSGAVHMYGNSTPSQCIALPRVVRRGLACLQSGFGARLRIALLGAALSLPMAVPAATIVVDSLADAVPASGASGCTLRKAIENANAGSQVHAACVAGGASNEITFALNGAIQLTSSDASNGALNIINRSLTITGNGIGLTTIRAAPSQHVFDNFGGSAAITITWRNLTVQNGNASSASGFTNGGGFYIETNTTAFMDNMEIISNSAISGGGAIDNRGNLTITNSHFGNNGANGEGGAINNVGKLTITGSTFVQNAATRGGAIFHASTSGANSISITNSTFSGNVANPLTVGMVAGGAIAVNSTGVLGPVTILHSTFANNVANSGTGGAFYVVSGASFMVNRSIVRGVDTSAAAVCAGTSTITSQSYSAYTAACNNLGVGAFDYIGPFNLNALGNNGGSTLTHSLPAYSPVRDLVPSAGCGAANDQTGRTRPQGAGCDPGAFEALPTVPQAPVINSVTTSDSSARVTFSTPNSGGLPIQLYQVVSSPGGITANGGSPLTINGLTNGVSYTFTVRAQNALGFSAASAPSNAVTPLGPPSAPTIGTATRGDGQATITFTPPAQNGGSPVTGYRVVSTPGSIAVNGAASPITVTGLNNGTGYSFRVQAFNIIGLSPASASSNQVVPATVPTAPGMGGATAGDGQALVTFSPPQNNGGDPVTQYTVVSNPGGISATGTASPIVVTGLTNGTAYVFAVNASNSVGPGPFSPVSNSVTPQAPQVSLTVTLAGSGAGTVSSNPAGISCGGDCQEPYTVNTLMTLTAGASPGSVFAGWSGVTCTEGNSSVNCSFTITAATAVTATFNTAPSANAALHDLNDDGKSDVVWRNSATGQNWYWALNGTSLIAQGAITTLPVDWQIQSTAVDFDGDGKSDILLRNMTTGQPWVWFMNGNAITGGGALPTLSDLSWIIAGTGDLNGDGKGDVVWRNTSTGQNWWWALNGTTIIAQGAITTLPTDWVFQSTLGDFNGDGKTDILLRNMVTGQPWLWMMDGNTIIANGPLPAQPDLNWVVAGTGDLNGDGKHDVVWRNTSTGQNWYWAMNGTSVISQGAITTLPLDWQIESTSADFDGDGKADILLRNTTTGQPWIWFMNGNSITGGGPLPTLSDMNWQICMRR